MEKEEIIKKLINLIAKEMENMKLIDLYKNNPEELIDGYFLTCSTDDLNIEIVDLQNELIKLNNHKYVDFKSYKNKKLNSCDSLKIKSDYTVLFSKELLNPLKEERDRFIVLNGGVKIKQSLENTLKQEGYLVFPDKAYVVRGENLPCKKLCKIVVDNEECLTEDIVLALKNISEIIEEKSSVVIDLSMFKNKNILKEINKTVKNIFKNKKIKYILIKNQ